VESLLFTLRNYGCKKSNPLWNEYYNQAWPWAYQDYKTVYQIVAYGKYSSDIRKAMISVKPCIYKYLMYINFRYIYFELLKINIASIFI